MESSLAPLARWTAGTAILLFADRVDGFVWEDCSAERNGMHSHGGPWERVPGEVKGALGLGSCLAAECPQSCRLWRLLGQAGMPNSLAGLWRGAGGPPAPHRVTCYERKERIRP